MLRVDRFKVVSELRESLQAVHSVLSFLRSLLPLLMLTAVLDELAAS